MGIGKVLQQYIRKSGFTVSEVARAAGVKPSSLQSMIDRDRSTPGLNLVRVAIVIGTTAESLYREAGLLNHAASVRSTPEEQRVHLDSGQSLRNVSRRGSLELQNPEERAQSASDSDGETVSELSTAQIARLRSGTWHLRADVPGLFNGAEAGDILVIARFLPAEIGATCVFRWDDSYQVCTVGPEDLEIRGPSPGTRPREWPCEYHGRVIGTLRDLDRLL